MKILINCVNLLTGAQGAGGAGQYVYHLIRELALVEQVRLLINTRNYVRFSNMENLEAIPLASNDMQAIHHHLSWCDVYFCPLNELVPEFLSSDKPIVTTILDLQHEALPHFFKGEVYKQRNKHYSYAIERADAVITISEAEKHLIQTLYPKKPVYVTHLAGYLSQTFSGQIEPLPADFESINYILYPAIPWRHKNHNRFLEAFWLLKQKYEEYEQIKLVLTGATHALASEGLSKAIDELNLNRDVIVMGHVSNELLIALMKHAACMAFPSLYEGFGIPVVDAMALEVPVIASPLPAISEVCQKNIAYFKNPYDSCLIADDLADFLGECKNGSLQEKLCHALNFSQNYSPKKTAEKTLVALAEVKNKFGCDQESKIESLSVENKKAIQSTPKSTLIFDLKLLKQGLDNSQAQAISSIIKSLILTLSHEELDAHFIILAPRSLMKIDDESLNSYFETIDFSKIKRVFYDENDESSHLKAYTYLIDAVIETEFFFIASDQKSNLRKVVKTINKSINTLSCNGNLDAIKFVDNISTPYIQSPLSDTDLISSYEAHKENRFRFFSNTILRITDQTSKSHVGMYRYLNEFLAGSSYVVSPKIAQ